MSISTYWIIEYLKVFFAYVALMYVFPSLVFRRYLQGKQIVFRFLFCVVVQILVINTVVLGLGLLHILNPWVIRVLFYGCFVYGFVKMRLWNAEVFTSFQKVLTGECGWKLFFLKILRKISGFCKSKVKKVIAYIRPRWLEYAFLFVIMLYGVIYFTYGAFCDYSYGCGDMYTHHNWIYALTQGEIFKDGVYPEAMHCFVYAMHTLFGIKIYSIQLFLGGLHNIAMFMGMYAFVRELFKGKYTPFFVMIVFLILDLTCINQVFSMARLQWTLPQEFGLFTQYICALYLYKYLNSDKQIILFENPKKERVWKDWILDFSQMYNIDDNLIMFTLGLAASLAIHFYTTIMAFFLCLAVVLLMLAKAFDRRRFLPLVIAILCGVAIAFAPMGGALLQGKPFQGSIGWAIDVMNGLDETAKQEKKESAMVEKVNSGEKNLATIDAENEDGLSEEEQKLDILDAIINVVVGFYKGSFRALYNTSRAAVVAIFMLGYVVFWIAYRIYNALFRKWFPSEEEEEFDRYLQLVLCGLFLMFLYGAPAIGLPEIVAGPRLCTTIHFFAIATIFIPIDVAIGKLEYWGGKRVSTIIAMVGSMVIVVGIVGAGMYHGYLYCELTRYNSSVMVTESIEKQFPKNTYTIVSSTDELYQVNQYGRHEDLYYFLIRTKLDREYYLPTEHVFIYIEKYPIEHGQNHFFRGPAVLALENKYYNFYSQHCSQCPYVSTGEISPDYVKANMFYYRTQQVYSVLSNRNILNSKVMNWCDEFKDLYDLETDVFYEDDNFLCVHIHQNPQSLLDFSVNKREEKLWQ